MSYQTVTLHCITCGSNFRIHNVDPITTVNIYNYCVNCGSDKIGVQQDMELTYWESLAQEYNMSIDALQTIYELWRSDPESKNFRQFVTDTKEMLKGMKNAV